MKSTPKTNGQQGSYETITGVTRKLHILNCIQQTQMMNQRKWIALNNSAVQHMKKYSNHRIIIEKTEKFYQLEIKKNSVASVRK
jgi:hypothetical protein